jgi:hypothetical protein
VYQGSLNFIIYFYFPILKELMTYVSCCLISINNKLLVVKCYSSLVVSGFSRNELNSCVLETRCLFYEVRSHFPFCNHCRCPFL